MNWLLKLFNQEKSRDFQPLPDAQQQDFTGVLHMVIEETIMAIAQWLIVFTKQLLERKKVSEQIVEPPAVHDSAPVAEQSTSAEELTANVTVLIEQLCDRTSSLLALEQRISSVERVVKQPQDASSSVSVEDLSQEVESLIQQLQQSNQRNSNLEHRIINLEKLLAKYSVIPKSVERQHHAIADLQSRINELEAPYQNNNHKPIIQLSSLSN